MKPANFPSRKAARQRSAAERRIPQILLTMKKYEKTSALMVELLACEKNNKRLILPMREVCTKKSRAPRAF